MYVAIRFVVASTILIAFYLTRGFDSAIETFVMAFAAFLAGQCVAFAVKMLTGEKERSTRALLFVIGCFAIVAVSVAFVILGSRSTDRVTAVSGLLDIKTLHRRGDTYELTIIDGDKRIPIRYRGALSEQVRDRNEIRARGQWQGEVFVATELLAKCPTSYNTPDGPRPATQYR